MLGVFGYFSATQLVAHNSTGEHREVVASIPGSRQQASAPPASVRTDAGGESVVPASNQYQVQTGDTLAGIAPEKTTGASVARLLDEICKANNLRNANVLSLGQKLNLPEYHTQPAQVAGAGQIQ